MKSFEIQTYEKGRWIINAVFDDPELAVFEAKRMEHSGRFAGGIRVIEDVYSEEDSSSHYRTIYRYAGQKTDLHTSANRTRKRLGTRQKKARSSLRRPRSEGKPRGSRAGRSEFRAEFYRGGDVKDRRYSARSRRRSPRKRHLASFLIAVAVLGVMLSLITVGGSSAMIWLRKLGAMFGVYWEGDF